MCLRGGREERPRQHLGASNDSGERTLGIVDSATQVVQLLLQQETCVWTRERAHTNTNAHPSMSTSVRCVSYWRLLRSALYANAKRATAPGTDAGTD